MDEHALREMVHEVWTGRIFYEPLAAYDPDGNISPILASEVPSVEAGTLAKDSTWVVIPVLWRNGVSASTARLRGMDLNGWDSTMWHLPYWHKV